MGSETTLIHYFVPEDYDKEREPNVFVIPKPLHEITLHDVHACFPL
jgi:hypothetical protein